MPCTTPHVGWRRPARLILRSYCSHKLWRILESRVFCGSARTAIGPISAATHDGSRLWIRPNSGSPQKGDEPIASQWQPRSGKPERLLSAQRTLLTSLPNSNSSASGCLIFFRTIGLDVPPPLQYLSAQSVDIRGREPRSDAIYSRSRYSHQPRRPGDARKDGAARL